MRPDSLLRLWHYVNHLLTYLLSAAADDDDDFCLMSQFFRNYTNKDADLYEVFEYSAEL